MAKALEQQDSGIGRTLHLALELSNTAWKLGFSDGDKIRQKTIAAGDLAALTQEIGKAKEKFKLPAACRVVSTVGWAEERSPTFGVGLHCWAS